MSRLSVFLRSSLPLLTLILATVFLWADHYGFTSVESLSYPTDYSGDSYEVLARIKAVSEGNLLPLHSQQVARLGAPFLADWNAYPTPDKPLMLLVGGLVKLFGLYPGANLALLLAQVSAVVAFYWVARRMRAGREWAWMGALLFAFTYHSFIRGLAHFSFVFTWTVPLGLLAVWLVAGSKRLGSGKAETWFCIAASALIGTHNPYFLFFWLQLLALALFIQALGPRRKANLFVGTAALLTSVFFFFVAHAEHWLFVAEPRGLPLLARNYGGTERYALKAVEMFIPPAGHSWSWFGFFGERYGRWSDWRGEAFLPYVGVLGILAFVWLGIETAYRFSKKRPLPGHTVSILWILSYSSIGGVTNILALFISFHLFRATNRAAIFISAILLFFLVFRLTRLSVRWPRWLRWTSALGLAAVGVWDQMPPKQPRELRQQMANMVDEDRSLGRQLEEALPTGAMVFQLPVLDFPEVVPPWRLSDYEHFRLYLNTQDLRFSYGSAKFRSQGRWQHDVEQLPLKQLVRRLEDCGFSALYINRKGYEDQAARLLAKLEELGYKRRLSGKLGNQVVVFLHPDAHPLLPLAKSFTFGLGWYPPSEYGIRWAYDDAVLSYFNPYDHPIDVQIQLTLQSVSPRRVTLRRGLDEELLGDWKVTETPSLFKVASCRLEPGVNLFDIDSDEAAVRKGAGRYQLRSFGMGFSSVILPPLSEAETRAGKIQ